MKDMVSAAQSAFWYCLIERSPTAVAGVPAFADLLLTPKYLLLTTSGMKLTFVPPQPNLKAASCANSSPNPNIKPLMNGRSRLIAAPRSKPHNVGGEYNIIGEFEEEGGGEGESSSLPEYCSESDGMVIDDSVSGMRSEAILGREILRR